MNRKGDEYALEFLLAFDGRIHYLEEGYWLRFQVKRVKPTDARPHGIAYSFSLHAPSGLRLLGFDNAHRASGRKKGRQGEPEANDHWHRSLGDPGRIYRFEGIEKLIDDFFDEVERVLADRGIDSRVVAVRTSRKSK